MKEETLSKSYYEQHHKTVYFSLFISTRKYALPHAILP